MLPDAPSDPLPYRKERSLIWGGETVGDAAVLAPYHHSWFNAYFSMMARLTSTPKYGILYTNHATYSGNLAPAGVGTNLQVSPGAAMIYRILYLNDANVVFDCAILGYYRVVLRLTRPEQTVRLVLIGPNALGYPPPVRSATIHDISIALVQSAGGGVLNVTDARRFARNITLSTHHVGAVGWYEPGSAAGWRFKGVMMQSGSTFPTATSMITPTPSPFARPYWNTTPMVFFQASGVQAITPTATKLFSKTQDGFTAANYYLDSSNNLSRIWWMSFGVME